MFVKQAPASIPQNKESVFRYSFRDVNASQAFSVVTVENFKKLSLFRSGEELFKFTEINIPLATAASAENFEEVKKGCD